ncbi:hypothetical protein ABZ234_30585 [Nocardiopsis sp. NPDC006198]|uniref:hypothetical protein n=1 Tax=Nocardiopsis sp. NPDC006198 TaxID=3154472 RepID=UPI0033AF3049
MPTREHALVTITLLSLVALVIATIMNGLMWATTLLWVAWVGTALVTTQAAIRGRGEK